MSFFLHFAHAVRLPARQKNVRGLQAGSFQRYVFLGSLRLSYFEFWIDLTQASDENIRQQVSKSVGSLLDMKHQWWICSRVLKVLMQLWGDVMRHLEFGLCWLLGFWAGHLLNQRLSKDSWKVVVLSCVWPWLRCLILIFYILCQISAFIVLEIRRPSVYQIPPQVVLSTMLCLEGVVEVYETSIQIHLFCTFHCITVPHQDFYSFYSQINDHHRDAKMNNNELMRHAAWLKSKCLARTCRLHHHHQIAAPVMTDGIHLWCFNWWWWWSLCLWTLCHASPGKVRWSLVAKQGLADSWNGTSTSCQLFHIHVSFTVLVTPCLTHQKCLSTLWGNPWPEATATRATTSATSA